MHHCDRCLNEGVELHGVVYGWNFGLVVYRWHHQQLYRLCRPCVHKAYWSRFFVLSVGWLGIASALFTVLFLVTNTIGYVEALFSKKGRQASPAFTKNMHAALDARTRGEFPAAVAHAWSALAAATERANDQPTEGEQQARYLLAQLLLHTGTLAEALEQAEAAQGISVQRGETGQRADQLQSFTATLRRWSADPALGQAALARLRATSP